MLTATTLQTWNESRALYENPPAGMTKSMKLSDLYVAAKMCLDEGHDMSATVARLTALPMSIVKQRIEATRVHVSYEEVNAEMSNFYRADGSLTLEAKYQQKRWNREVRCSR